jgi:hypothetical protein
MIEVVCSCGETHKTPEKNAGRSFKCPKCGAALRFPQPNQSVPMAPPSPPAPVAPPIVPPTPPIPKQDQWFYASKNSQVGPHSIDEMRNFGATGVFTPQTLVWHEGMSDWLPAKETELNAAFPTNGVTPPPIPSAEAPGGMKKSAKAGILAFITILALTFFVGTPISASLYYEPDPTNPLPTYAMIGTGLFFGALFKPIQAVYLKIFV